MTATFISIGEPAHDGERQAIQYLVDHLPSDATVYGNPWLVERSGTVYEVDAIVVRPHALYVVEIKAYTGRVAGTDHDWYVGAPERRLPSPLRLNRKTAQVLKSQLRLRSIAAGQVWVQGLVFLSGTARHDVRGPASADRVHTRKTIISALDDPALVERLSGGRQLPRTTDAERDLLELLTGVRGGPQPVRAVGHYDIVETLAHADSYTEFLGRNRLLPSEERLLRVYRVPPLATAEQRQAIEDRVRWEAQILGRIGKSPGILSAELPFVDESGIGIVLPFEHFSGITLASWLERYGPTSSAKAAKKPGLEARTELWLRIARAVNEAHAHGVVHRLLRPEVILVEDAPEPRELRVTGFDLAKRLGADSTAYVTHLDDDRLVFSAPEVVQAFSDADKSSDQFSLGALCALLVTGHALFSSTRERLSSRHFQRRVRDLNPRVPLRLDEAVTRMLSLRRTDRFAKLDDAIEAVRRARDPAAQSRLALPTPAERLDPDNLVAGDRLGRDYEIVSQLGRGGLSVVYAARHLPSNRTRALKIARADERAEEALRGEYEALGRIDHPNIVRVIDLTQIVPDRLTLAMERVGGQTLRDWLLGHQDAELATRRRLAEDLLAGLGYLEQQGVTHKDLKPDNLLVGDDRLTIIDFSLAAAPQDALFGGTALYRDPAQTAWSHGTDRYAAALCLFELYAGRHAFDGHVPEPGERPHVTGADIEPPGLAAFFQRALHPTPEQRFASVCALRDALLAALGAEVEPRESSAVTVRLDETTPLSTTGLPARALNELRRTQIRTVGQLLALSAEQIRAMHGIGITTTAAIVDFQAALRARGLAASTNVGRASAAEPSLLAELARCTDPIDELPARPAEREALAAAGLATIGAVASLTRQQLLAIPGVGKGRLRKVVAALHRYHAMRADDRDLSADTSPADDAFTLDGLWAQAAQPLPAELRQLLERCIGLLDEPIPQVQVAADLGRTPPAVSRDVNQALEDLDRRPLAPLAQTLDHALDALGGLARLDDLGGRFEEQWPAGMVQGAGMIRLLLRTLPGSANLLEDIDGIDSPVVARPAFDRETVRAFAGEVLRLAGSHPFVDPEAARHALAALLPSRDADPLALGERLCADVQLTSDGHLFIGPIDASQAIAFVIDRAREPFPLDTLRRRVDDTFGEHALFPEAQHDVLAILQHLDCEVRKHEGGVTEIVPGATSSIIAAAPREADALRDVLELSAADRSPEALLRDLLIDRDRARGFRMLITPPEHHRTLGRSVARTLERALGATWVSFDDAFFSAHGDDAGLRRLARAERFAAQRRRLTEAAEQVFWDLLAKHGRPGQHVVVGDTGLLGLCGALDLPRRFYDEVQGGAKGFWLLVVPGVIHKRQPYFNEHEPLWHLEGATLPLAAPLPE